ncbi:MAG: serine hydrolase [Verrucomicrobiales bacterium]|nr:serine hydrolase [Verrucomicrobiales bacterium]
MRTNLTRWGWVAAMIPAMALAAAASAAGLPRSTPEAQGVSSAALVDLVEALDQKIPGMHSIMVVRHGRVIAEGWWGPYAAEHNHVLYSLSKSFTSTAMGFAVAEGRLSIDDEVMKFFPGDWPTEVSNNLKAMRVRDILTMTTGHQDEPPVSPGEMSAKSFLAQAVPHLPGTHFKYNTPATFMQSAIVQKLTGQTVLEYLRPRLFEPLGIENPVWDTNFEGICLGGYGLRVRTEDIAKFGQFYLQKGRWNGKEWLPAGWVAMATSKQVSNGSNPMSDWNQGYGFQFWRCRHQAFRGDGAFGQYCVVLPDQDAVVAITSGTGDMQAVLNLLWDKLLPALGSRKLRSDHAGQSRLHHLLKGLEVPAPAGEATSPIASKVLGRRYDFPANDQKLESVMIQAEAGGSEVVATLRIQGIEVRLPAGHRQWRAGRTAFPAGLLAQFPDEPVAGKFAWVASDTLVLKACAYETPFHVQLKFRFDGDQVTLDREVNVAFGPSKFPSLAGRTKAPR